MTEECSLSSSEDLWTQPWAAVKNPFQDSFRGMRLTIDSVNISCCWMSLVATSSSHSSNWFIEKDGCMPLIPALTPPLQDQGTAFGLASTSSGEAAGNAMEAVPLGFNPNSGILRYGGNNQDVTANPNLPRQSTEAVGAPASADADQTQSQVGGLVALVTETAPSTAAADMDGINESEDSEDRKTPGDSAESSPDSGCC
jgi:hypothetical protein